VFPGTYKEFLWSKENRGAAIARSASPAPARTPRAAVSRSSPPPSPSDAHDARKRDQAVLRKRDQEAKRRQARVAEIEAKIAEREQAMKDIESAMSAPGFYDNRDQAQPLIDRHQTLMWEVGDLMHQWEELQRVTDIPPK
jgi:hypothetical protein